MARSAPGERSGSDGARRDLSALLEALARVPDDARAAAWTKGLSPGDVVGRFEILGEIGRGGFGVVYEALDRDLGRKIAIKTLRPTRSTYELSADWLKREAEAAARLDHPGIVTVLETGVAESGPWIAMQLLRGATLAERLRQGPLPAREAIEIGSQIASALAHAHDRGILHRDLKPANVFLTEDGRVMLLDLGLAHLVGSRPGPAGGTPAYMAPEQLRGEAVDARADVYALGALLHEALAGRAPLAVHDDQREPPLGGRPALPPSVPPPLARQVLRFLDPDPARRPANGAAAATALQDVRIALERPRLLRQMAWVAGAAALIGVALATVAVPALRRQRPVPPARGDRVTIAVADVENRTGDPDLEGLEGLLRTALQEAPSLRVLTRGRMYDALKESGQGGVARIDEPLARLVGQRLGARALLVVTAHRIDRRYTLDLQAIDPASNEYLFGARESGEKEEVLAAVDRLAARVRQTLAPVARDREGTVAGVAELVTPNLEAYSHYAAGKALEERGLDGVMEEYRKAVELQPDFALARYAVAQRAWIELRSQREVRALTNEAIRVGDRAPVREGMLLRAWNARFEGRDGEARALYHRLLELYPDDKEVLVELAGLESDPAGALTLAKRALEIDPEYVPAWWESLSALVALGRQAELAAAARRWSRVPPSNLGLAAISRAFAFAGELDLALEAARRAAALGPGGLRYVADIHEVRGEYLEEEEAARRLGPAIGKGWTRTAIALRHQGRRREALALLDDAQATGKAYGGLAAMTAFLFSAGDPGDDARARAEVLLAHRPDTREMLSGALALGGHSEEAAELASSLPRDNPVRRIADALARPPGPSGRAVLETLTHHSSFDVRRSALFALGQVCFGSGDLPCAVDSFSRFRSMPAFGLLTTAPWATHHARLSLARAHERSGHSELARREVEAQLAIWRRADPDLPDLIEAKALCARVHCRAPRSAGD